MKCLNFYISYSSKLSKFDFITYLVQFRKRSIKENLIFTGDDSPMANLSLSVMGAFAEFERSLIKERQMEGISLAKKKGLYKGRAAVLNQEQVTLLQSKITLGITKAKIARELNISRRTLYNYIPAEPSKSADHV
ncbi:recombinase family protein [Candidatus Trichorickettsia mobilis]